jgi:hypothetical protein
VNVGWPGLVVFTGGARVGVARLVGEGANARGSSPSANDKAMVPTTIKEEKRAAAMPNNA